MYPIKLRHLRLNDFKKLVNLVVCFSTISKPIWNGISQGLSA